MRRSELMGAQPWKSAITAALATAQAGVSESPMERIFPSRTRSFSVAMVSSIGVCVLAGVVQPVQVDVVRAETREASPGLPGR